MIRALVLVHTSLIFFYSGACLPGNHIHGGILLKAASKSISNLISSFLYRRSRQASLGSKCLFCVIISSQLYMKSLLAFTETWRLFLTFRDSVASCVNAPSFPCGLALPTFWEIWASFCPLFALCLSVLIVFSCFLQKYLYPYDVPYQ